MGKFIKFRTIFYLLLSIYYLLSPIYSIAAIPTIYPGNVPVSVGATIAGYTLNLSGYASPNASIVLSAGGQYIRSTVADEKGNFFISQVSIREGISSLCFTVVDFRRLGESEACIDFEPLRGDKIISDIFLPPTIGFLKKQINAGGEAVIFGFSMPYSKVSIRIKNGQTITVETDATGYYEYRMQNVKAGTYFMTAEATYESKKSLPPKKEAKLEALSVGEQVTVTTKEAAKTLWELLTSTVWGFFSLLLILLIIIVILILILKPSLRKLIFDKFKQKKLMHHDWLLEFIEINSS